MSPKTWPASRNFCKNKSFSRPTFCSGFTPLSSCSPRVRKAAISHPERCEGSALSSTPSRPRTTASVLRHNARHHPAAIRAHDKHRGGIRHIPLKIKCRRRRPSGHHLQRVSVRSITGNLQVPRERYVTQQRAVAQSQFRVIHHPANVVVRRIRQYILAHQVFLERNRRCHAQLHSIPA